jgi:hypothetical protein
VDRFMTKPFRNTEFVNTITDLAGIPLPQAA